MSSLIPIDDVLVDTDKLMKDYKLDPKTEKLIDLEFDELKEDIKKNGQQEPIVINNKDELISGFKRLVILKQLGQLVVKVIRQ